MPCGRHCVRSMRAGWTEVSARIRHQVRTLNAVRSSGFLNVENGNTQISVVCQRRVDNLSKLCIRKEGIPCGQRSSTEG